MQYFAFATLIAAPAYHARHVCAVGVRAGEHGLAELGRVKRVAVLVVVRRELVRLALLVDADGLRLVVARRRRHSVARVLLRAPVPLYGV